MPYNSQCFVQYRWKNYTTAENKAFSPSIKGNPSGGLPAALIPFFGRFFSYGFAMKILPKKNAASNLRRDCYLITGINCDRRDA